MKPARTMHTAIAATTAAAGQARRGRIARAGTSSDRSGASSKIGRSSGLIVAGRALRDRLSSRPAVGRSGYERRSMKTFLTSVYSSIADMPSSRPMPDIL